MQYCLSEQQWDEVSTVTNRFKDANRPPHYISEQYVASEQQHMDIPRGVSEEQMQDEGNVSVVSEADPVYRPVCCRGVARGPSQVQGLPAVHRPPGRLPGRLQRAARGEPPRRGQRLLPDGALLHRGYGEYD